MKKSILLMAGLIGLALTSCEEKMELGTMQKNEAPVIVPADGVALQSKFASTGNTINLQNYVESAQIPLVDIEISNVFPASSTVTGEVEIADNADFNNALTIPMSAMEAPAANQALVAAAGGDTRSLQGIVLMEEWESAFVSFYGQNPAPRTNYLRYRLWLSDDKQKIILYNNDGQEWFDPMEFMVTPLDAKLDVAASYTLLYSVNGQTQSIVMYHNADNHQYDDPMFNAMVEVPEDASTPFTWTVAPTDNLDRVFGVAEGTEITAAEGDLAEISAGGRQGEIEVPGTYQIEVNMLEKTFTVKIAPRSLYVMCTAYSGDFSNTSQLGTTDYVQYSGFGGLLSGWGLTGQASFRPTVYVNNPAVEVETDGTTTTGGLSYYSGNFGNDQAIPHGSNGLYYLTANLQSLTYTMYYCSKFGITGSMPEQNWGEGSDVELKSKRSDKYLVWSGTVTLNEGDEWKFRANGEWAINLGAAGDGSYATDGTPVELTLDGGNFKAAESGTYTVTVNLLRKLGADGKMTPYTMTVVKQ